MFCSLEMRRLQRGNLVGLSAVFLVATFIACASNGPTSIGPPVVLAEWVTGAAAAALGRDGHFVLPAPAGGPLAITEANARAQAVAWARSLAVATAGAGTDGLGLERDYGGKIRFADLRDCRRAFYAESAFGPVPDDAPRSMLNAFGPYWLIRLCSPSGAVPVVLAVAVTSGLVVSEGLLVPPRTDDTGNEFRAVGIPRGTPPSRALPLEPEAAVAFVVRATGRRVSELPVFVQRVAAGRPDPFYAQFGYWRVTLESPVHGTGVVSGAEYDTREVAVFWPGGVTNDTTLEVALSAQPDTALHLPYSVPSGTGGQPTQSTARLSVRAPYLFEALRAVRR